MKEEFPVLKLDVDYLSSLKKVRASLEDKVYDTAFALNKYRATSEICPPRYEPIARKVELIVRRWKDKKTT